MDLIDNHILICKTASDQCLVDLDVSGKVGVMPGLRIPRFSFGCQPVSSPFDVVEHDMEHLMHNDCSYEFRIHLQCIIDEPGVHIQIQMLVYSHGLDLATMTEIDDIQCPFSKPERPGVVCFQFSVRLFYCIQYLSRFDHISIGESDRTSMCKSIVTFVLLTMYKVFIQNAVNVIIITYDIN